MWGFLATHLSLRAVVGLGAIVMLLRFRRWKAVGGAAVGAIGSAATIAVTVVGAMFLLVALGYWDPPVGEIIGDALTAGRAFYDLVGEWLVEQTVERLEDVAN